MYWKTIALGLLIEICLPVIAQVDKVRGGIASERDFVSRYALISANQQNMQRVRDPAGSGRTVLQLRVGETDEQTYGGLRTEISASNDYIREGVRWYAMSVYFPSDWRFHAYPTVVAQLHTSQKSTILSPPLAFVVHNHDLDLELYANHRPVDGPDPATRTNSARQLIRLDRLKTEQWYCFVVRADWSHRTGNGSLKVWMNGDKVYEAANLHNSYETWLGNYPRAGLYMPGMKSVNNRMIYVDFIHTGGPRTSAGEMAALTPCTTPVAGEIRQ